MSRARWVIDELGPITAGVIALIAVWTLLAAVTSTSSIPSPLVVWDSLRHSIADGQIPRAAFKTLIRLAFSFVVAVIIGVALGIGLSLREFARRALRPIVVALQIVPPIAWLPLAIVWFDPTERAVVFVTIAGAFPSMTLSTLAAFRQVDPVYERAGRTLGANGWTLYRKIVMPAAMPGLTAGLQQTWGFAWKALMAAELITRAVQATGLGQLLERQQTDVPALLATIAVIVIIGVAVDYLVFGQIDRRVRARRGLLPAG
jgi:NitT/TauT family transport system permease protein